MTDDAITRGGTDVLGSLVYICGAAIKRCSLNACHDITYIFEVGSSLVLSIIAIF